MPEFVSVEVTGDGIATLRLDNAPLNLLTVSARAEFATAVKRLGTDPGVRAVILYGGDKVFSAGDDARELLDLDAAQAARFAASVQDLFDAVAQLPKPVVAAISGYAISSGAGLALCADWRIIGDNVKLAFGEVHQGGIPLGGTLARLMLLAGQSNVRDLVFSGRFVEPDEAKSLGLVDEVVAPDDVYTAAMTWAMRMRHAPTAAVGAVKRVLLTETVEDHEFSDLASTAERRRLLEAFLASGPVAARG
ncbi:MAG: enoyl-CoA hydratase/isomerase family protein [Nocardiaceae bacterium]|nr:enoyl-CoA hydratase/isomerase family protein [Nocardiaceae bacterium]